MPAQFTGYQSLSATSVSTSASAKPYAKAMKWKSEVVREVPIAVHAPEEQVSIYLLVLDSHGGLSRRLDRFSAVVNQCP